MDDFARKFSVVDEKDLQKFGTSTTTASVQAFEEKGYNPTSIRLAGYDLLEDPTYHRKNHTNGRPDRWSLAAGPG
ncbi:MAG: IreB family regulatory phosphoprotein [Dysosmobacter sp.]